MPGPSQAVEAVARMRPYIGRVMNAMPELARLTATEFIETDPDKIEELLNDIRDGGIKYLAAPGDKPISNDLWDKIGQYVHVVGPVFQVLWELHMPGITELTQLWESIRESCRNRRDVVSQEELDAVTNKFEELKTNSEMQDWVTQLTQRFQNYRGPP